MSRFNAFFAATLFVIGACTTSLEPSTNDTVTEIQLDDHGADLRGASGEVIGRVEIRTEARSTILDTILAGHEIQESWSVGKLGVSCARSDGDSLIGSVCSRAIDADAEVASLAGLLVSAKSTTQPESLGGCHVQLDECFRGGFECSWNSACTDEQAHQACRSLARLCTIWGY
jgi:hypothetical protein